MDSGSDGGKGCSEKNADFSINEKICKCLILVTNTAEASCDDIYGQDFKGYILYRATDPEFNEIKTVTDNQGKPFYYEPLAQFDLKDGIKGPHPIAAGVNISGTVDEKGGLIERVINYPGNGAHFYMGNDTGPQHYYVDNDVQNGRTYYYAIVAYDKGYDFEFYKKGWSDRNPRDGFKPIYPVQNSKTITQNVVGNIIFTDRNTAVITPNAATAGTEFAKLDGTIEHEGPVTGWIDIFILQPDSLKAGNMYRIALHLRGFYRPIRTPRSGKHWIFTPTW